MTHGEWLKREVAAWKSDGLVDAATADRILGRYAPSARRLSWGIMIIGGFGAFLIGLGIIALFAANWDCFGRAARAAISLSPVVLCGVIALVATAKGVKATAFWESLGILWCVSTVAATCLVAQTYQVGHSFAGLVLLVSFLTLPVVWVTRSVTMMSVWPILVIVWACVMRQDSGNASVLLGLESLGLMALSLPAYVAFVRRGADAAALVTGQIVTGLVYSLGLALTILWSFPGFSNTTSYVLVIWGCCAAITLAAVIFRLPVWPLIAALVTAAAGYMSAFCPFWLFAVALVVAAGIIAYGISRLLLPYTNIGASMLLGLILFKFIEKLTDFTTKGIVMIAAGVVLIALNIVFVQYRRRRG